MYVCVCNGVTDRAIREVVANKGAHSLYEVQCHLPVASCCGRCEQTAHEVINEQLVSLTRKNAA